MASSTNNKYTILITGKLDPTSIANIQTELDKMNNVAVKVTANITQFGVSAQSIAALKAQIENRLGTINVNLAGTGRPAPQRAPSDVGRSVSSASGGRTFTEEEIRNNSVLLQQYEKIAQKVKEATAGAQARITVETNGEGVITRVNALYQDLENKIRNINYVVTSSGELERTRGRYTEDNIKKQKEQLKVIEKSKETLTAINNILKTSNPASETTQRTQQIADNLNKTLKTAERSLTGNKSALLDESQIEFLQLYTTLAKSATNTQKALNAELEKQSKYLDTTKSYAANLKEAASTRAQSIPQVKNAIAASDDLIQSYDTLNAQVEAGIPLTKEQIAAHSELAEETKLAATAFKTLGGDTKSFTHEIGVAISRTISWSLAMGAVYGTLNQIKDGIAFINELDEALTNIRIVTGDTADATARLAMEYNTIAKELGTTTQQVAQGSLEFIRQGKTQAETNELIRVSTMQAKLANMDAAQSSEYLTSIMNGFNLEASDMMGILDKLVMLDNNYATSVAEIATALQRSSVSARLAGVSLEELASMVTVVSSVSRQSAESIGESFSRKALEALVYNK